MQNMQQQRHIRPCLQYGHQSIIQSTIEDGHIYIYISIPFNSRRADIHFSDFEIIKIESECMVSLQLMYVLHHHTILHEHCFMCPCIDISIYNILERKHGIHHITIIIITYIYIYILNIVLTRSYF